MRAAALALVAIVLASPGCLSRLLGAEAEPAPAFALTTLDGRNVTLSTYAGRILFLDFMATTCQPCEGLSDDLGRLRGAEGVEVLSVSVADDPAEESALRRWQADGNKTWDHAIDRDAVFARYRGSVIPYVVVVDEQGVIRGRDSGTVTYSELVALTNRARAAA